MAILSDSECTILAQGCEDHDSSQCVPAPTCSSVTFTWYGKCAILLILLGVIVNYISIISIHVHVFELFTKQCDLMPVSWAQLSILHVIMGQMSLAPEPMLYE